MIDAPNSGKNYLDPTKPEITDFFTLLMDVGVKSTMLFRLEIGNISKRGASTDFLDTEALTNFATLKM